MCQAHGNVLFEGFYVVIWDLVKTWNNSQRIYTYVDFSKNSFGRRPLGTVSALFTATVPCMSETKVRVWSRLWVCNSKWDIITRLNVPSCCWRRYLNIRDMKGIWVLQKSYHTFQVGLLALFKLSSKIVPMAMPWLQWCHGTASLCWGTGQQDRSFLLITFFQK